jgi:hypothetical protein
MPPYCILPGYPVSYPMAYLPHPPHAFGPPVYAPSGGTAAAAANSQAASTTPQNGGVDVERSPGTTTQESSNVSAKAESVTAEASSAPVDGPTTPSNFLNPDTYMQIYSQMLHGSSFPQSNPPPGSLPSPLVPPGSPSGTSKEAKQVNKNSGVSSDFSMENGGDGNGGSIPERGVPHDDFGAPSLSTDNPMNALHSESHSSSGADFSAAAPGTDVVL